MPLVISHMKYAKNKTTEPEAVAHNNKETKMKKYRVLFTDGNKEITKDMTAKNLNHLYCQMDTMGWDVISYQRLTKVSDLMTKETK